MTANPKGTYCSHGCGNLAPVGGIGAYCDRCHDDSCLVPPDGVCGLALPCQHDWGKVEYARFTGNPHRRCIECGDITLDLEDEEEQTLGSCGCTDYHMADCPTRTGGSDYDDYPPDPYDSY